MQATEKRIDHFFQPNRDEMQSMAFDYELRGYLNEAELRAVIPTLFAFLNQARDNHFGYVTNAFARQAILAVEAFETDDDVAFTTVTITQRILDFICRANDESGKLTDVKRKLLAFKYGKEIRVSTCGKIRVARRSLSGDGYAVFIRDAKGEILGTPDHYAHAAALLADFPGMMPQCDEMIKSGLVHGDFAELVA